MKALTFILFLVLPLITEAQCIPSRHSTSLNDGWVSCAQRNSPNPARGSSHWIQYDLSTVHHIEDLQFWNYNHPDHLSQGARDIVVDFSSNGVTWTEVAALTLERASGASTYIGELGPIINQSARHVLITILNTYGSSCAALGEVRIGVNDENNCPSFETLAGDLGRKSYGARFLIQTNGETSVTDLVRLEAAGEVRINEGFTSHQNALLEINIAPCN